MKSFSLAAATIFFVLPFFIFAQTQNNKKTPLTGTMSPAFRRVTTKTESFKLGMGGTVTLLGAPAGSISIEAWRQPMIEVTAEIETEAATQEDLVLLAQANSFALDADLNHIRIVTTGAHDKAFLKKSFPKFPKRLINAPFRVDYRVKVPAYTDLEINAGRGKFDLRGVEGAIVIKALEADAALDLNGGDVQATFGGGTVNVRLNSRSWRGRGLDVQLARGEMNVALPPDISADLDAEVLRTGNINNALTFLKPHDNSKFTERFIQSRAGAGGATLKFTVGDGTLKLSSQ